VIPRAAISRDLDVRCRIPRFLRARVLGFGLFRVDIEDEWERHFATGEEDEEHRKTSHEGQHRKPHAGWYASIVATPLRVGRYVLHHEIASGGMARVYFGRMIGPSGFGRTIAVKRMHPQYASDPEFAEMFLDEAKLAARVQHPNVTATIDVVSTDEGELLQVMEYVPGEALSRLVKKTLLDENRDERIPIDVVSAIMCDALHGLHAAHEATDESGEPIGLVHRDVSPQNLLVGSDGHTRVLDFGVAKAAGRLHSTKDGRVKGKIAYMSPEQLRGEPLDRRADIYSAGIVLWELLTGQRLFMGDNEGETAVNAMQRAVDPPSKHAQKISAELDAIVLRALARDRTKRFGTARQMAIALEECVPSASARRVGEWIADVAGDVLRTRAKTIVELEAMTPAAEHEEKSSASVEVTPTRTKRSSARWWVVGAAVVGVAAFAIASNKQSTVHGSQSTAVGASTAITATITATASASASASTADSVAAPVTASVSVTAPASVTAPTTHASVKPKPSAIPSASAGPCPLRSYVDGEGILRFTRDCPP
jgi:eukaryotic-like serine/threonine-protein kinase